MPRGVFLYPSTDQLISFPKHTQDGKPFEIEPKPRQVKPQQQKGFWRKLQEIWKGEKQPTKTFRDQKPEEPEPDYEEEEDEFPIWEEEW